MDGYITTRGKCACGGVFRYDERRGDLFCQNCGARCQGSYIVRMGRAHYRSFGRNLAAAEQHLNHIRCQRGRPDMYGNYDPRDWQRSNPNGIQKLSAAWIEKKEATRPALTGTRLADVKNAMARALEFWGDKNVKLITEQDLAAFAAHDHKDLRDPDRALASKTIYDICQTLNEFLAWAARMVKCEPVKFKDIGYDFNETEPITIAQQQLIIEWVARECPEPMITFGIVTLCRNPNVRPGELIAVQWRHVDLLSGIIYIHKRKSRRKLKRAALKPKKIFVTRDQLEWLKKLPCVDLNDYLFTYSVKRSGVTPGSRIHSKVLNKWLKRAASQFGIDTNLYAATKHTTTTELRKHYDRETVRKHGPGHRSEAFAHYDHSDGTREALEMREAWDKMRLRVVGCDNFDARSFKEVDHAE